MMAWPAIAAARAHNPATRAPFFVAQTDAAPLNVGSVAQAHLRALTRWPQWLQVNDRTVTLHCAASARAEAMATMHDALRAEGLIVAWRDEAFPLFTVQGDPVGVAIERAATRFWGSLTLGRALQRLRRRLARQARVFVDRAAFVQQGHRPGQAR